MLTTTKNVLFIFLILHMWKLKFWDVEWLMQSHTDSKKQDWDSNPVSIIPELILFFKKKTFYRFYLFISGERKREGEREGEKHRCAREVSVGCLSHTPDLGPGLQHRHMPWQGIENATFQFAGRHPIHWATPARARAYTLDCDTVLSF